MFRFTIRELVLLTLVVAIGAGWAVDHSFQAGRTSHWRGQAIQVMNWVDKNCAWVDVGLTDDDEILILREATTEEREAILNGQ
jgi:hypothetical protein